jgi:peptidoglycan/xylan/chitin deacetylase (PgdA/CDA1 family)
MPALDATRQRQEVAESHHACAALTGTPVQGFAFPFGDFNEVSIAAVRDAGLGFACTIARGAAKAGDDPLRLPRIMVGDWDEATFRREVLGSG